MRNKFTELIEQGVASFNYTSIAPEIPEQDPICRAYNNIWSIPSDTHMACVNVNGECCRVITGRLVSQEKWGMFVQSSYWGAVEFRTTGYWCLADFFWKHNLEYTIGILNGDVVAFVKPIEKHETTISKTPNTVVTTESQIPQPITTITNSGNALHVAECFKGNIEDVVNNLNNSTWIKGNNWIVEGNNIIGLIGNKTYILGDVNEGKDNKHQIYTMSTIEHNGCMRLTVWNHQWDSCDVYDIADTGKVISDNKKKGESFLDDLDKNIKGFDWAADLKLDYGYSVSCDLRLPDGKLNYIHEGPWYIEAYKGYEVDTHYGLGGGLKKRRR